MLTVAEFAEKIGRPYPTVAAWVRNGAVPGAEEMLVGRFKVWQIPADVEFTPPPMGRPKKAAPKPETKPAAKKRASKKAGN